MAHLRTPRWAVVLAAAAVAGGCGRGGETARAQHAAHERAQAGAGRAVSAAAAARAAEADLVSAVSAGNAPGPVSLRFRIQEPPRVGQPLRLELVLAQQPGLEITNMLLSLQPGEGLALESDRSFEFQAPATGATQRMLVTLRADQAGLLNLGATVLVNAGNDSVARSFSIPLIAVDPVL